MHPLGRGDFLALVGLDLGQDIGHLWRPLGSAARDRDQVFQPRRRRAAVERIGADRDALFQVLGAAGHDQRRCGIQQRDVAVGAGLAVEHARECQRVGIGIAAPKRVAIATSEACILRRHLERGDLAVVEAGDETWPGEGDFIEPVGAVHDPDGFGAEIFQDLRQPVPTTSTASAGARTRSILPRIADTAPVISSTVSPRTRSAINSPPICEGVASPDIMLSKADAASSRDSVAPVATFPMIDLRSSIACFQEWGASWRMTPLDHAQLLFAPVTCAKAAWLMEVPIADSILVTY